MAQQMLQREDVDKMLPLEREAFNRVYLDHKRGNLDEKKVKQWFETELAVLDSTNKTSDKVKAVIQEYVRENRIQDVEDWEIESLFTNRVSEERKKEIIFGSGAALTQAEQKQLDFRKGQIIQLLKDKGYQTKPVVNEGDKELVLFHGVHHKVENDGTQVTDQDGRPITWAVFMNNERGNR